MEDKIATDAASYSKQTSEVTLELIVPAAVIQNAKDTTPEDSALQVTKLDTHIFPELILEPISPAEEPLKSSVFTLAPNICGAVENAGHSATFDPTAIREGKYEPVTTMSMISTCTQVQGTPELANRNTLIPVSNGQMEVSGDHSIIWSAVQNAHGMEAPVMKLGQTPCDTITSNDATTGSSTNNDPGCAKENKGVRKNIPPKRDRLEPLKMDMSKHTVMPLTSSQLSLHCLECHIIFSDHKSRERHLKMSHPAEYEQCMLGDALFACYVCDRHFTCSTELMAHQRTHTERLPFKCPMCGEAFSRSSELTLHKKVHFGQHGYTCSDCGKPCKTLTLLKYHKHTHTGEKPYVCKECGKRFSLPKSLQKHLITHSQDGNESSKDQLNGSENPKKRRISAVSERKFLCTQCDAVFKTSKTLRHHMVHKHSQGKNIALPGITVPGQPLKLGVPMVTQSLIGQPTVLRMEAVGPAPQQVETLGTEQIKKLIETLGNVQKVNQVVILGLDQLPFQTQMVGTQQSGGLAQPICLNFTQPTSDTDELKQRELQENTQACNEFKDPEDFAERGADQPGEALPLKTQEEVMIVTEGQILHTEHEKTKEQLGEVELLSAKNEVIAALAQTSSQIWMHQSNSTPDMTDTIESPAKTGITTQGSEETAAISVNAFEKGQTFLRQEECMSVPMDIMVSEETVSQMETTLSREKGKEMDTQLQTEQMTVETITINKCLKQEGQEAFKLKATSSSMDAQNGQTSSENDHADQKAPISIQQSVSTANDVEVEHSEACMTDQMSPVVTENVNVTKKLRKKGSKKRRAGNPMVMQSNQLERLSKRRTSMKPTDSLSVEKKRKCSRVKKDHLLVRFGPQENRVKPSKQNRSEISETQSTIYPQGVDLESSQDDRDAQIKHINALNTNDKEFENSKEFVEPPCKPQNPEVEQDSPTEEMSSAVKSQRKKNKNENDLMKKKKQDGVLSPVSKKTKRRKMPQQEYTKEPVNKLTLEKELKKKEHKMTKQRQKTTGASKSSDKDEISTQALLLLKGHKQPQLKVHKLDAFKSTAVQISPTFHSQSKNISNEITVTQNTMPTRSKKGTHSKSLKKSDKKRTKSKENSAKKDDLLSQESHFESYVSPVQSQTKQMVVRKRKAIVDKQEALSPPYSRLARGCQDCGMNFSEVSTLQEHMASMHTSENRVIPCASKPTITPVSDDLIFCNKIRPDTFGIQESIDWDVEVEMGEVCDREEQRVSFPALNPSPSPSPSLSLAPGLVEAEEQEGGNGMVGKETAGNLGELSSELASGKYLGTPLTEEPTKTTQHENNILPTVTSRDAEHLEITDKKRQHMDETDNTDNQGIDTVSKNPVSVSEPLGITEEEIKDELPVDMCVMTVGDQCQGTHQTLIHNQPSDAQESNDDQMKNDHLKSNFTDASSNPQTQLVKHMTTTDCSSAHQQEIKEEDEDIQVQRVVERKKSLGRNNVARGRRKGGGRGRRSVGNRTSAGDGRSKEAGACKETDECQVIYQLYSLSQEFDDKPKESNHQKAESNSTRAIKTLSNEGSPVEQVVFELESVTTSVVDILKMDNGASVEKSGEFHSTGNVPERILTTQERTEEHKEQSQTESINTERQTLAGDMAQRKSQCCTNGLVPTETSENQEIKTEDRTATSSISLNNKEKYLEQQTNSYDEQLGVQMVLVKDEDPPMNKPHVAEEETCLNVGMEDTQHSSGFARGERTMDKNGEEISSDSIQAPPSSARQCIFYPVKEEEAEIPVLPPQNDQDMSECPGDIAPAGVICEEIRGQSAQMAMQHNDYSSLEEGIFNEQQNTQDLLEFLSQAPDSEDSEHVYAEPEAEALILSCYRGIQSGSSAKQCEGSSLECRGHFKNCPQVQHMEEDRHDNWGPMNYFCQYFGWDTWREIAAGTAHVSKLPNPVTAKEVAQFVGIHIAMGTLKFPCMKLYWNDCTRVPLIADAMSFSRFSEISCKLAFAHDKSREEQREERDQPGTSECSELNATSQKNEQRLGVVQMPGCNLPINDFALKNTDSSLSRTDPLWKVRSLINRVQGGCQTIRRHGNHGVDQYPLSFQRYPAHSLHHTVMVSYSGLILDFHLSIDDSKREDIVENMVSRDKDHYNGTIFLCKPELSTPSMLEHLLGFGVRSAGKVGGARGQVGDEFVSSDGKLKLFRCHHGFILAAAEKGRSRSASLVSGFERALKAVNLNRDLRSLYRTPCTSPLATAWPQSVLWDLIDLALVNSWLQYKDDRDHNPESLSLMAFRLEASKTLIMSSESAALDSTPPQPPAPKRPGPCSSSGPLQVHETTLPDASTRYDGLGHWPEQLTEAEEDRCRFGGCERMSRVRCLKCCVFLCISRNHNCFLKFHSQGSL